MASSYESRGNGVAICFLGREEELGHQPLDDLEHVVGLDEAHLEVDLRELGLAIAAQVLVAEALDDLEVPVEPGHHVELLEELRRFSEARRSGPG